MVAEPEKTGLHPVGKDYKSQSDNRVDICHHTIFGSGEHDGVERNQTPVQEAPDYAADTIDGGVFKKRFNSGHGRS